MLRCVVNWRAGGHHGDAVPVLAGASAPRVGHRLVLDGSGFVRERVRAVVTGRRVRRPAIGGRGSAGDHVLRRGAPSVQLYLLLGQVLERAAVCGEGPWPPAADGIEESGRLTPGPPAVSMSPGSERLARRPSRGEDGGPV